MDRWIDYVNDMHMIYGGTLELFQLSGQAGLQWPDFVVWWYCFMLYILA